MMHFGDSQTRLRWSFYWLLITLSTGAMLGRILSVNSVDVLALQSHLRSVGREDWQRDRPFLSPNDRSRWATVRALVEHGTYAIDDAVAQRGWDTIDMVKHMGRDGEPHLYSSKPPLFATLMAIPYWWIHESTGATLGDHPFEIGRAMLILINGVPLIIYFYTLALLADRWGTTDCGRVFMIAVATLGTYLSTFAVTINNHIPAAVCVALALHGLARIWFDGRRDWADFRAVGFFSALAITNEWPALSCFALSGAALVWKAPRQTVLGFLPAALLVGGAALGTNYAAHASLLPPYTHRGTESGDNWNDFSYTGADGNERDSYWRHPVGVDCGEPSLAKYAMHTTIGHHGIFSLTPAWILSVWGLMLFWWQGDKRELVIFISALSVVCLAFYILRPQMDRNYGGVTSGFRWMFWFAPMWLVTMLPAADGLSSSRGGQAFALLLLGASVMSASYPTWSPWTHPWLWNSLSYFFGLHF